MKPADTLRPTTFEDFASALGSALGHESGNFVGLATVGSTNALGRRLAQEYLGEERRVPRTVLVAWEQTAGRGRRGNQWQSPTGQGVYATLVMGLADSEEVQRLPLVVGVALCEALNRLLPGGPCRLKWPNDLMVRGEKIGGLLIEVVAGDEGAGAAVIGFGINFGQQVDGGPSTSVSVPGATSILAHAPAAPDLAAVAAAAILALLAAVSAPSEDVGERYATLSLHQPGDAIAFRLGEERITGLFRGFDERGFLRLEQDGALRVLSSGEVIEP